MAPAPTPARSSGPRYGQVVFISIVGLFLVLMLLIWLTAGRLTIHFLNQTLQEQYQVSISEQSRVTLNPFLSRITINDLELMKEGETVAFLKKLQLSWMFVDLLSKNVILDEAHIDGLFLKTDLSVPEVAGIPIPAGGEEPAEKAPPESGPLEWTVSLPKFTFTNSQFEVKQILPAPRQDVISLDVFEIKDLEFSEKQLSLESLLRLRLNEAPLHLSLQTQVKHPLSADDIQVNADANYSLQSLDLAAYDTLLPEEIKKLLFKAGLQGDITINWTPKALEINQNASELTLQGIDVDMPQATVQADQFSVQLANLQARRGNDSQTMHLQVAPKVTLRNARIALPENAEEKIAALDVGLQNMDLSLGDLNIDQQNQALHLSANDANLSVKGLSVNQSPIILESASNHIRLSAFELEQTPDNLLISATPSLELGNTQLYLLHDGNLAASWDSIRMPESQVSLSQNQPDLSVPNIQIENLILSRPFRDEVSPPLAQLDEFNLKSIQLAGNRLQLGEIELNGLKSQLILSKDRQLTTLIDLPESKTENEHESNVTGQKTGEQPEERTELPAEPDKMQTESASSPFQFSLNQITIGKGSEIQFVDQLGKTPFTQQFEINEANFGPLDSGQPGQASHLNLDIKTGDYGKIILAGDVTPLTDKLNMDVSGKIQEIDLPPTSIYIREALGYDIESGQLNTDIKLKVKENQLNGEANALLRSFDLTSDSAKQSTSTGALTLNAAVGLLKNSDNNIELDIPMSGDLADPNFGIGSFVAVVLKKALMVAAQEALLQSLVPYAGVASLAVEAGSQLMKITFAPLVYAPTQVSITLEQQDFVGKLAAVLKQNKDLQVKTCAVVTPLDLAINPVPEKLTAPQIKSLTDLGLAREKALKEALIKAGVESARVLQCKPTVDSSKGAKPKINLET